MDEGLALAGIEPTTWLLQEWLGVIYDHGLHGLQRTLGHRKRWTKHFSFRNTPTPIHSRFRAAPTYRSLTSADHRKIPRYEKRMVSSVMHPTPLWYLQVFFVSSERDGTVFRRQLGVYHRRQLVEPARKRGEHSPDPCSEPILLPPELIDLLLTHPVSTHHRRQQTCPVTWSLVKAIYFPGMKTMMKRRPILAPLDKHRGYRECGGSRRSNVGMRNRNIA